MEKKKLRCPIGAPAGIIAALIGLTGVIVNIVNFNLFGMLNSFALFILAMPFVRILMMVHSNNDRLDELEKKAEK